MARASSGPDDVERVLGNLRRRLRAAARPGAIADDDVRSYCAAIGERDHRLEGALLRRASEVVDADLLIDRLVADARARLEEVPTRASAVWLNPRCQPPAAVLDHLLPWPGARQWARVRRLYWARLRDYLIWVASAP